MTAKKTPEAAPAAQTTPTAPGDQAATAVQDPPAAAPTPAPPVATAPAPPVAPAAQAPPAAPPAPPAPAVEDADTIASIMADLPHVATFYDDGRPRRGLRTLIDACLAYGIDPRPDAEPLELGDWKFYQGQPMGDPEHIRLVTAGGVKLKHYSDPDLPMDPDTERVIRTWLRLFKVEKDARTGEPVMVPTPMPDDLTLPAPAVTGRPNSGEHRYDGGYLRSGGRREAARREAVRGASRQRGTGR